MLCMALDCYNNLTPHQKLPCPKLEYSDVISYSTLGNFSLLKVSHADVLMKPWAQPANHEMAMKYFKVLQSKEEITCLNVEVHWLTTWVNHDEKEILAAKEKLWDMGFNGLVTKMQLLYAERHQVNSIHYQIICKIYTLDGYNGQMPDHTVQKDMGKQADNGKREEKRMRMRRALLVQLILQTALTMLTSLYSNQTKQWKLYVLWMFH